MREDLLNGVYYLLLVKDNLKTPRTRNKTIIHKEKAFITLLQSSPTHGSHSIVKVGRVQ